MSDDTVNGSTLVLQTISKISEATGITVQFSEDNSTWTESTTITDGFQSIDLRTLNYTDAYIMFNLSTSNVEETPYLNQSRLITSIGVGDSGVSGSSYPFLIPIGITVLLISTLSIFFIKGGKRR